MPFYSLILVALAMSTDAFAAAIGKGARMDKPTLGRAVRTGALFGLIEGLTPIVGWLMGRAAVNWASHWDHWIAFALLLGLGLHMLYEGLQAPDEEATPTNPSRWRLATTALATSIDALAVGVGLAFVEVNILVAAGLIGLATFSMVTLGIMVGRAAGALLGKRAEILGGVILMAVGGHILYDHLSRGI